DVDRAVLERQVGDRRVEEPAARIVARELARAIEQILRDVVEDDGAVVADVPKRLESDQPVAAADVEHDVAVLDAGALKDPVANELVVADDRDAGALVTAVAAFREPPRPPIAHALIVRGAAAGADGRLPRSRARTRSRPSRTRAANGRCRARRPRRIGACPR